MVVSIISTEKPKIIFVAYTELLERLDDFRVDNPSIQDQKPSAAFWKRLSKSSKTNLTSIP